jgi:hypothetical protein
MAKRKRGILSREKVIVDGKEIEVDTFDVEVVLGSGTEFESIEVLLRLEEADKVIKEALSKIETIAKKYAGGRRDIWYYYEAGQVLQFVDSKDFIDRSRYLVWQRMAYDLRPDLFGGMKKNAQESKRYPETMYHLGKQLEKNIGRANFEQWYEIVKFKDIYRDKHLLERILQLCEQGLSSIQLRQRIKELRVPKSKTKSVESS